MSSAGDIFSMSDEQLKAELRRLNIPMGGAGDYNRERAIQKLIEHYSIVPIAAAPGYESPTGLTNLSSVSASQTQSHPSSTERPKLTNSEQRKQEDITRGAVTTLMKALRNTGDEYDDDDDDDNDDDEVELQFSVDEIGYSEPDDDNLYTEAYLFGVSQDIQIGDDTVLGYLYDISEGDEASNDGKSVVENLINRFADEITEDVKVASYRPLDDSVISEPSESSSVLSKCSATGVLHLLAQAAASLETETVVAPAVAPAVPDATRPRSTRVIVPPKRLINEISKISSPKRRRTPCVIPTYHLNSNSGSAKVAEFTESQNTQATQARKTLKELTKIRIEHNRAPSQAKKIHGDYADGINGKSICSLCGFTLEQRQPLDKVGTKWSYDHTIPVNLVALYFRIICSGNKYSKDEVEIMSHLGDVSCWNCNYTKSQARFISIPHVGPAIPRETEIENFLKKLLDGTGRDALTRDGNSTLKIAISKINVGRTYDDREKYWKEIQTENLIRKVKKICELLNKFVDIKKAQQKLQSLRKHIRECQAVAKRNEVLKLPAFKQILSSLSSYFPWKEEHRTKLEKNRQSINKLTYDFPFDTQNPEIYKGFGELKPDVSEATSGVVRGRFFNISNSSSPKRPKHPSLPPSPNTRRRLRRYKQRKTLKKRKGRRQTRRRA